MTGRWLTTVTCTICRQPTDCPLVPQNEEHEQQEIKRLLALAEENSRIVAQINQLEAETAR